MAMLSTQKAKGLKPTKAWQRKIFSDKSAAAATAQTWNIDIPRDHFIHEIIITCYEHTAKTNDPTYLDDALSTIQLVANGNKVLKDGTADMFKQVMKINGRKPATGLYELFFTDPKIGEAQPLPAWIFTSLRLTLQDIAPASTKYNTIEVAVVESAYEGQDLTNWKVLVEKYLKWQKYGANTGEQIYEHERAYKIYGYLYVMDDNGTLADYKFDNIKLLGRKPEGELTIVDVPTTLLKLENNAEIGIDTLSAGYAYLEWKDGFPAHEFASLYTKPNIASAGTNIGLRVLERYVL